MSDLTGSAEQDSGRSARAIVYVSWGGTGRAASVRQAMRRAVAERRPLIYLAVLDDGHFADLDSSIIDVLLDELDWLLDAQLELTKEQLGADELDVRRIVRAGDVIALVDEVIAKIGPTDVLLGAPVPVVGHDSMDTMTARIERETGSAVQVVAPPA